MQINAGAQEFMQNFMGFLVTIVSPQFQAAVENPQDPNHAWATATLIKLAGLVPTMQATMREAVGRFGTEQFQINPQDLIARFLLGQQEG